MLILRCSACKSKLWRYDKVGRGEVLRCHKGRIEKDYENSTGDGQKIRCRCGKVVGIDKGSYIKMIAKTFTCSGTKRNA
jgi:hypothetical protein